MRKIMLFLFLAYASTSFSEISISTVEELQKIGNDPAYPLSGDYYLTNNIDASTTYNWNDGRGFIPIMSLADDEHIGFSGSFNGNGFSIRNLHINHPNMNRIGLFGYLKGGQIKNLIINRIYVRGSWYVGGLAGYADYGTNQDITEINNVSLNEVVIYGENVTGGLTGYFKGNISNCSVEGLVSSKKGASGLAAAAWGTIKKSHTKTHVSGTGCSGFIGYCSSYITQCFSSGSITGDNCGGLILSNFNGTVLDCFSNCNIDSIYSNGSSAGLLKENQWKVKNSYATGQISGKGNLKGLIAVWGWYFPDPPEVTDFFYDYQTTGQYDDNFDDYGIPKSTKDMMDPATFENWDFENVWWMIPGKTYPLLRPERYIDVSVKPAEWMPELKYGFPLEYEIVFGEEMSDRFTFDDIDFTSSTLESPVGTLTTENGTTWTLMITDTASTPTWPADLVLRVPLAGATNLANYPCAESNATSITIQAPATPGDLNGDGVCDEIDKMILVEMIIEPSSPWKTRIPFTRRDLNEDNIIDVADVVAILPLMNKSR